MVSSTASGASRRRMCWVKVPTPGPYSTNNLQFAQSTGASMRSISTFEEGMTDPTITGCFRNPLRNCQSGPPDVPRWKARDLCACSPEKVMPGPEEICSAGCVGKSGPQWQGRSGRADPAGTTMDTQIPLPRDRFALLFAVMLVAASGNTAMQSLMPAIGRELHIHDLWVAVAFSLSAVAWVAMAPHWARRADRRGRRALMRLGLAGFIASMLVCGTVLALGLDGNIPAVAVFPI